MEVNKNKIPADKKTYLSFIRALAQDFSDVTAFSLSMPGMCIIFSPSKTFLNQLSKRIKDFLFDSAKSGLPMTFDYTTKKKTVVLLDNLYLADEDDINRIISLIKLVVVLSAQDIKHSVKTFIEDICECFDVNFELFNLEAQVKFNKFALAEILCLVIFEYLEAGAGENPCVLELEEQPERRVKICSYIARNKFILELQFENIKNHFSFEINSFGEMVFEKYLNDESMLCVNTHS